MTIPTLFVLWAILGGGDKYPVAYFETQAQCEAGMELYSKEVSEVWLYCVEFRG